jgi:hypothetical protein
MNNIILSEYDFLSSYLIDYYKFRSSLVIRIFPFFFLNITARKLITTFKIIREINNFLFFRQPSTYRRLLCEKRDVHKKLRNFLHTEKFNGGYLEFW